MVYLRTKQIVKNNLHFWLLIGNNLLYQSSSLPK